jgi:fatty-acyl-CoA synthase
VETTGSPDRSAAPVPATGTPLSIGGLLADAAAVNPSGPAVTLGHRSLSYSEVDASANRLGHALAASGTGRGSTVAWWCGPRMETVAALAAVARLGAVLAPVNPAFQPAEARTALEYLHPSLIVADAGCRDAASEAAPDGCRLLVLDQLDEDAASSGPLPPPPAGSDSDPHVIYLTSGTTGRPKGVVVSQRASWLRSFPGGSTFAAGLRGPGGILASFPLFHYGGFHYVLEAWHHRRAFHICERFDGESLIEVAELWHPSAMYCIPAVWNRVLDASPSARQISSVRHADTGTSAAPTELLLRLRELMPEAATSVHYGSSEGGHHSTLHDRDVLAKPGSVGQVAPGGVVRLSDEGEILYRGPTLMDGYFEMPEETAAAMRDGWYHTGDVGAMDGDGYLYVTGRVREMIRSGGEYVSPVEVEAALAGLPGVAELAIIGLPDQHWGDIVCAVVVPQGPSPAPTVESVRAHLDGRLAAYKHPRRVVSVPAIPRTPATGQVQRTLLRDLIVAST